MQQDLVQRLQAPRGQAAPEGEPPSFPAASAPKQSPRHPKPLVATATDATFGPTNAARAAKSRRTRIYVLRQETIISRSTVQSASSATFPSTATTTATTMKFLSETL